MERLERVGLLARADERDGPPGDVAHGQGRAAARVAVQLRQRDRVDADRLVEAVGDRDRVLPRHRVQDQEHVMRRHLAADQLRAPAPRESV